MAAVLDRCGTGPRSFGATFWNPGVETEKTAKKRRKNEQKWARYGLTKRVRVADLFVMDRYTHGLLPQPAYTAAHTACGWADFLLPSSCKKDFTHPNAACKNASHVAQQYLPETWDPYNGKRSTLNKLSLEDV